MRRFPVFTGLLACGALALLWLPLASEALQFDRAALARGELWRLLTGHFTHFSGEHLVWDLLVFVVFGVFLESHSRRAFLCCLVFSVTAISAFLWIEQPQLTIYRGLSGIDSALFVAVSAEAIRRAFAEKAQAVWLGVSLGLVFFVAKLIWETLWKNTLVVRSEGVFVPVPLAHEVGAAVGFLAFAWGCCWGKKAAAPNGAAVSGV